MNDFLWHIDSVFFDLVKGPLLIIGIACAVLIVTAAGLTAVSRREEDDA